MPLEQLAARIDDRFRLLTGGSRAALPRHRTLRAVVDWSWGLLEEHERALARKLAVFNAGATEESAAAVADDPLVLDGLASLADKSLLQVVGNRYRMLETIREYGAEQLDDGQRAEVIELHGTYYERLAHDAEAGLRGPDTATWLATVEQELPNLRAAMARALERELGGRAVHISAGVFRYWQARSSATEGRGWIESALAADGVTESDRAVGFLSSAGLAFFQGDLAVAQEHYRQASEAAAAAGLAAVEAEALAYLAWVAIERGEREAAGASVERSVALLREVSDPWERSEVLMALWATELELSTRSALGKEVLRLTRETGDIIRVSDSLNNLGWDALVAGEPERAIANLEEAAAIARELDDTFRLSLAVGNLGLAAVMQERYLDARELLLKALRLTILRGDRRVGSEAVHGLAAAAAGLGDDEQCVRLNRIQRELSAAAGIARLGPLDEQLYNRVQLARDRLGAEQVAAVEAECRESTLDAALELAEAGRTTSVASAKE